MNVLLQQLEAAIAETERIALAANHNGRWFTYGDDGPDEGRLYVLNGEDRNDGWAIAEFTPYEDGWANALGNPRHIPRLTSMQIRHIANVVHAAHNDPNRVLRRVARDRKLVELHTPKSHAKRAFVEEAHRKDPAVAHEPTGALMWTACPTCGGRDWDIERFDDLEPCDTLRLLAEDYEIEVGP